MARFGLIGFPVSQSYSKYIHEHLEAYRYDLIELKPEEVKTFLLKKEFQGLNVTMPYKQTVIPFLDQLDPTAANIGAVNTIVNRGGVLTGYNTDYFGFRYMMEHHGISPKGKKVLVFGNGGAAKAVLAALKDLGAKEIIKIKPHPSPETISLEEALALHKDGEILVNTSPVGMAPNEDAMAADPALFPKAEAALDIIYHPQTTQFLAKAKHLGMVPVGGLEMLVVQALYAIAFFLDQEPDLSQTEPVIGYLESLGLN